MKLLYQTHSPFARKTLVFAHEIGLADQLEVIHQETSPVVRNDAVFAENPLGKVPVLLRPGLPPIFDSDVICAYLDTLHSGRRLIPMDGETRWRALAVQAVAQGLAPARRSTSLPDDTPAPHENLPRVALTHTARQRRSHLRQGGASGYNSR